MAVNPYMGMPFGSTNTRNAGMSVSYRWRYAPCTTSGPVSEAISSEYALMLYSA